MVLYCEVKEGNTTVINKSEVYVKPKRGAATFISYWGTGGLIDPERLAAKKVSARDGAVQRRRDTAVHITSALATHQRFLSSH